MDWELVLVAIFTVWSVVVALVVASYAWRRRAIPGAKFFALYMLAAALWALGEVVDGLGEFFGYNATWAFVAEVLFLVGIFGMPAAWLVFALKYTGRDRWLTGRTWIVLFGVPIVALLLWFAHAAMVGEPQTFMVGGGQADTWFIEAFAWIMLIYITVLILTGGFIILQEIIRAPRIYQRQYLILLIGGLAPWLVALPALWGFGPDHDVIILVAFVAGGLIAAWGIFRYQVFDITPIALDTVVENISDGVIVLDTQNRIVSMNPAAQTMTRLLVDAVEGQPIEQVLPAWRDLPHCLAEEQAYVDISLGVGAERRCYDVRFSPLYGQRETLSGRLVLMRDITERQLAETEIRRVSDERARRNRELTLLNQVIDAVTSQPNPQAVLDAVCRELALAFEMPRVGVALAEEGQSALKVVAEHRGQGFASSLGAEIPIENNPATLYVMEHKVPLAVADAQNDPRMALVHDLMKRQGIISLLILPLIVRGEVVGTVGIDNNAQHEFTKDEIALAMSAVAAASQALERTKARKELRVSEERYRSISELTSDLIYSITVTPEGGFEFDWHSGAFSRITGYSWEELESLGGWPVLVHPDDMDYSAEMYRRALSAAEAQVSEYRIVRKDGETRWLRNYWQPVWDEDRCCVVRILGASQDITEHTVADRALRESEERLKLAIEGADLGLWDMNLATGDREMSIPGLFNLLGYAPGELESTQECWQELMHPGDQANVANALQKYFTGQAPLFEVEHRLRAKSGEWVWFHLRGAVVERDEEGHPQRMTGIYQNITERKQMETAVHESEERLKIAMEAADLALWDQNLSTGDLVVAHPSADGDEWGYDSGADRRGWKSSVHPEDWPHVRDAMQDHLSGKTPIYDVEFRSRWKGKEMGDWVWWSQRGRVVVRDEQGQPVRVTGIQENITARKQAEEELRQAKEAAETANRAKSAFLANMSHELRTPLNAILGFSQLMDRDPGLPPDYRENLETIRQSGEHLLTLINDVLEVSKIEAGRMTLQARDFDLHRLLADVESMFRLRAADRELQLIFDRDPDVPQYVRTDESKLRQVLINLLSNAVKFTEEGGITVRVVRDDNCLHFEVEDSGIGIALDEIDDLFDPFVQTASSQTYAYQEGTGLGLTITQHFVQLMGGSISVSSELGHGSTFKFDVRIDPAEAVERVTERPRRKVIGLDPDQPVYRLLVVEDREANRRILIKLLSSLGSPPHGFEIREALNGQEAIDIWEEWEPHFIWMDMRMPVMDGYEATKRIKATTKGQATVIVALTASAFEEDRKMILSLGCDDFVRKPFRESEIFEKLETHLGVRFLYADEEPTAPIEPTDTQKLFTLKALAALPADWVSELHQAAAQADADLVLALVEQISTEHQAVAQALTTLVHNFRFDTILSLTEQVGG